MIDFGFKPSPYQEKIFNFIQHGNGNAVISAKAGSGKTTTCVEAIKLISPNDKVLFLAFNKSIAEELTEKVRGYANVQVRTSHSLGYAMIRSNVNANIEVDEYKYRQHIKSHINEIVNNENGSLKRGQVNEYVENVISLVDFARFNLSQTPSEVRELARKYDIPIMSNECEAVIKILEWGKGVLDRIDYTDMVWLPVELSLDARFFKKDFIFIDECQDQSIASIQLFLKCFKMGSRFIAIGDRKQCVNVFAGASEGAFQYMQGYQNTTTFDLPVCYRCPKVVVKLAQTLVPDIKYRDDAPEGVFMDNCPTTCLRNGDMVLCRSKAPLVELYTKLLKRGVQCHIRGREMGESMVSMVSDIRLRKLNADLKGDGVFVRLYGNLFEMRNKLMETSGLDYHDATLSSCVTNRYDMIKALKILAEHCTTKKELTDHIHEVFDEKKDGVMLSTIHKAKGLEADNVYILCNSSMPLSIAKKKWEKDAEENLIYVAYTRAKKKLGFISEEEIKPCGISQDSDRFLNEIGAIETAVCRVLGKKTVERKGSVDIARFNLSQGITKIVNNHENDNCKVLKKVGNTNKNNDLLAELDGLMT